MTCKEATRCALMFLNMSRTRPSGRGEASNSDDLLSDVELFVSKDSLPEALQTSVGGRKDARGGEDPSHTGQVGQHDNSSAAMEHASEVWNRVDRSKRCAKDKLIVVADVKKALAAARSSQQQQEEAECISIYQNVDPELYTPPPFTAAAVSRWLQANASDMNDEQTEIVKQVAAHTLREASERNTVEPLRWLLHGKPGTGKSHTIKKVRQFFDEVAGFTADVHYQIAALQATMAIQIDGDTLHHALHIRKGGFYSKDGKRRTHRAGAAGAKNDAAALAHH